VLVKIACKQARAEREGELTRAIRVNFVSENASAHNAHQPPTDNTRTDADLLRARLKKQKTAENGRNPGWGVSERDPNYKQAHLARDQGCAISLFCEKYF
jgi:hypothetical protein